MAPLIVPIKENLYVLCLDSDLEKELVLHLLLMKVLANELDWVL